MIARLSHDTQPRVVSLDAGVAMVVTDLHGAIQGGAAGWCLHNGDNRWGQDAQPRRSFDMRKRRLFEQLDSVELEALKKLPALVGKAERN